MTISPRPKDWVPTPPVKLTSPEPAVISRLRGVVLDCRVAAKLMLPPEDVSNVPAPRVTASV